MRRRVAERLKRPDTSVFAGVPEFRPDTVKPGVKLKSELYGIIRGK
jgi:hypothetical protein